MGFSLLEPDLISATIYSLLRADGKINIPRRYLPVNFVDHFLQRAFS